MIFYLFSLVLNVLFVIKILPAWLQWTYVYTYALLFGNTIFYLYLLSLIYLVILLLTSKYRQNSLTWFSRQRKINWSDFRQRSLQILIALFLFLVLLTHIILHFIYQVQYEFSLQLPQKIYVEGWWKHFIRSDSMIVSAFKFNIFNNVGFLFDSIFNLLYIPTFSAILPILVLLTIFIFILHKILDFKLLRIQNRLNIIQYQGYLSKGKYLLTTDLIRFFDFVFVAVKYFQIDFKKNSYKILLNQLLNMLDVSDVQQLLWNDEKSKHEKSSGDDLISQLEALEIPQTKPPKSANNQKFLDEISPIQRR
ncbi:hypothetical protein [Mycoplasmopsis mustelae]|nr:hypothetical protein [Mycoplasmopsis mustelae]